MSKIYEACLTAERKNYRVSTTGIVTSGKGRVLKLRLNNAGYYLFNIRQDAKLSTIPVHKYVAYLKYGKPVFEKGVHTRHKNGNPKDNTWSNILIGSSSDNMMDRSPEDRMRSSLYAASFQRKYDKELVKEYYKEFGWSSTLKHFSISSKGTLHYILK